MRARPAFSLFPVIPVVLFLFIGCGSSRNYDELFDRASRLIDENPDTALVILNTVDIGTLQSDSNKARYAFLKTQAIDKSYRKHGSDSLIRIAVDYYSIKGTPAEKANAYYMLGRVYSELDSIKPVIHAFLKALDNVDENDYLLKGLIYYNIGHQYYLQEDVVRAREMIERSIVSFNKSGDKKREASATALLARNYFKEHKWSKAIEIYHKALKIYGELNSVNDIMDTAAAITSIYYQCLGEPERALEELNTIYDKYNGGRIPLSHYPLVSHIYYNAEDIDKAVYYLEEYMTNAAYDVNSIYDENNIKLTTYYLLSQYEAKRGNYREAYAYVLETFDLLDLIYRHDKENLILEVEKKYEQQELQNKYEALQKESNLRKIIYMLAILIIFLIMLRIIASRRDTIREKNRNIEELESYIDNLNSQIGEVEELRDRLSGVLSEKNDNERRLMEVMDNKVSNMQKILELASLYSNNAELFHEKFKKDLWQESKNEYFGDMYEIVNNRFYGVIEYLKEKYPDLNNEDLNLCCLICFGFSNNQISLLFGHTNPDSIFTKRHKLRKKLGIWASKTTLESFIGDILKELEEKNKA